MSSDGKRKHKRKGAVETTDAVKRRALSTARRLTNLAVVGFPPMDQLKARVVRLSARVSTRLNAVPVERQQPAPATIAAPTALHYALLGESDEVAKLREMFEKLLVSSMDSAKARNAHPAFVSMISQLTPDEARILESIDADEYSVIQIYELRNDGEHYLIDTRTELGIGIGIDESRQLQYISNLDRLGILRLTSESSSDIDENNALFDEVMKEYPGRGIRSSNESIIVTPFGRQFLETCVRISE